jgi:hypothetical protein
MAAGTKKLTRLVAMIAAVAVYLSLDTSLAFADARLCRRLEAQLAALSSGSGSAQYKKYDKAIAAQRAQLQQARGQARGAGCGFSLFGRGESRCGGLHRTIDRMEKNLATLQSKRTQLAGSSGSNRQRNRLLASLDANGCRDRADAQQRQARRSIEKPDHVGSLFEQIFNGRARQLDEREDETPRNVRRVAAPNRQQSGGQFRTLCVLTCDGYYFPISPSSSFRDFERDQQNCDAMCPGTEVQIYYQDAGAENAEAMVSTVTGEPYAELPAAFLYRQSEMLRPAQCGCNPAKNYSVIAGTPPTSDWKIIDMEAENARVPSEGSILTLGQKTTDRSAQEAATPNTTTLPPPGERKVRVVGPVFLPDPAAAIDLRAPAPKKVQ